MKIAIIGATGNVGSRLTDEALRRGHTVTALARQASTLPAREGVTARDVDVADTSALAAALRGSDAVISTVRFLQTSASQIVAAVKAAGVERLLVVGGAGSLYVAPGVQLVDTPTFPDAYKAEASAGRDFLDALRAETSLAWTFLSPSALFTPGERTGKFRVGNDDLLTAADGKSWISMEDYAIAMLDEIEQPKHVRERFTVGY
ncbi:MULTISPECIES: NAD(P)-dependent oxidoreductase [unclassified Cupriavidus]|uniref:NAD(P)-dependent oxidoreductase n=1 Tax=unclassified Cupriavidus TaxID=2640874 RepID=UPI001BFFE806|nr:MULTISPECIES: NAD(P)-dependent oxidoreductase [unclassified Cupriavidus]MCA3191577.1 NAD(P)-dependent oxidoreductase [Cupriavidus sp.]MCA3199828.1 NAD(P)-dependent oxidoreductase [Cupriavidus sp.]MCA3201662.1 NAD(P)-dependent oxidoreductase [Cupriavidus sp.]MCA3209941.1 NAD(P)-dependent oxidoreductase [Cupriavidus sp.]MCA3234124.1 NAD(P)-dependent oxidoreductase [Cupriavidus sp.]